MKNKLREILNLAILKGWKLSEVEIEQVKLEFEDKSLLLHVPSMRFDGEIQFPAFFEKFGPNLKVIEQIDILNIENLISALDK